MMQSDDSPQSTKRCLFPSENWQPVECQGASLSEAAYDELFEYPPGGRHSPTSVTTPSVWSAVPQGDTLKSTVIMCENGAEVTLDLDRLVVSTPRAKRSRPPLGEVRNANSLLDVDCTPTPDKMRTPNRTGFNICCASTDTIHEENEVIVFPEFSLQRSIAQLLGDATGNSDPFSACVCSSLTAESPVKEELILNPRNRAFNVGARNIRVGQLRRNLAPFSHSPRRIPASSLQRSRSFTVSDTQLPAVKKTPPKRNSFNVLRLCTMPENVVAESPVSVVYPSAESICYDSDPEDFTRRRSLARTVTQSDEYFQQKQLSPRMYAITDPLSTQTSRQDDMQMMQELMNCSVTLILHSTSPKSGSTAIRAWLEKGQQLHQTATQPKWAWCSKHTAPVPSTNSGMAGVELLDVLRILTVSRIDRTRYPLANPSHCFLLRTVDENELCFEAKSVGERDRLVYTLKLVVARFASKVLMQDETVFREFYINFEDAVPGEAPDILVDRSL